VADTNPPQGLRFEVAFTTDPDATTPAWVDLSSRVHVPSGLTVNRGRENEFDKVAAGRLTLSVENTDGALTPDNTSSPYYPNVLPQKRCRLNYRDPATVGACNLVPSTLADFETGSLWSSSNGATPSSSTVRADQGTKSMLVTWPTGLALTPNVRTSISGLVIGRTYSIRARVYVPTGSPNVHLRVSSGTSSTTGGADVTVKDAWADATHTFVADDVTRFIAIYTRTATTAGQQVWVDSAMLDEGPGPLGTFTTAAPVVLPLFDGHVDEWPVEWPDGGQTFSRASLTALDLMNRIGNRQKLRSIVVETLALDSPLLHFPLGESSDATSVASVAGSGGVLSVEQIGTGGTLEFGSGTGVPTDGASSPVWTSASLANGKYLTGYVGPVNTETGRWAGSGVTLAAAIASTSTLGEPVVTLSDRKGNRLQIGYNPSPDGRPFASFHPWNADFSGLGSGNFAVVRSGASMIDGTTHDFAVTITPNGAGTSDFTLELFVDGVSAGTTSITVSSIGQLDTLTIGGQAGVSAFYAGTISHVAVWGSPLTAAQILEHSKSMTTGFAGERSDQRIARVCTWIGLPTARQNLDVGNTTSVGHIDTTGLDPLDYMRRIETTEAGLLFAGTDGRLTFYNRARSYSNAAPTLTIAAELLDESARLAKNLQLVTNDITGSRQGGATVRTFDQASINAYGPLTEDLDLVTTTDDDVAAAVAWRFYTAVTPRTRFTQLPVDALTDSAAGALIRAGVDLGVRVQITGMPSQAPASTLAQTVQGYTLTIGDSAWTYAMNASPYSHMVALVLDDATYGALDSYPLAY
jgi:hypothetical protein